jgi:hypothetical protein
MCLFFLFTCEMEWREREKAWNRSCPNECKVSHGGSLFLYPKKFRPTSLAVLVHAHWRISARFIARQKMVGIVSHARVFQFSKTWRNFFFIFLWIKLFSYITWPDWVVHRRLEQTEELAIIVNLSAQLPEFPSNSWGCFCLIYRTLSVFRTLLLSSEDEGF